MFFSNIPYLQFWAQSVFGSISLGNLNTCGEMQTGLLFPSKMIVGFAYALTSGGSRIQLPYLKGFVQQFSIALAQS